MKNNKGITLVALIITIIVMMILVAVSVTVALDRGLFSTAKKAGSETQLRADEEMLLSAVVGTMGTDAKVDFNKLKENLPTGFTKTNEETYISPNGNVFAVTENGEITEGWVNNGDGTYVKGYKTVKKGTVYTTDEVLKELGLTKVEGKYDGNWIVIGVEGDKIKLVSANDVGNRVTLGYSDPKAIEVLPNGTNLERSIWSYQHAVETLNTAAKTATGITSVESIEMKDIFDMVEEKNIDKGTSYGKNYHFYYNDEKLKVCSKYKNVDSEEWSSEYVTEYVSQIFVNAKGQKVVVDSEGDEIKLTYGQFGYTLTDKQKEELGSLVNGAYYWIASTDVFCKDEIGDFFIFGMYTGKIINEFLFSSSGVPRTNAYGVRAVVLI